MSRYEETEHRRDAVMEQIDRIMIRRRKIERFIESVKDLPELIAEFDEALWAGLVDSMTVHSKDRIVFQLTLHEMNLALVMWCFANHVMVYCS